MARTDFTRIVSPAKSYLRRAGARFNIRYIRYAKADRFSPARGVRPLFAFVGGALIYLSGSPTLADNDTSLPEAIAQSRPRSHEDAEWLEPELAADDFVSEELLLFQDLPVVVSAARQEQPINQSSVPISVITDDDIHASGLTNLYEIIQFQPGVDMLQIDRNRYALGVRGLHEFFSDRTLTLIDGRIADSPIFGGSELLRLPIFLEDIERIEVVRGPGGAAWGANAFNGALNIITKDPEETHGTTVSSTINEFGDYSTHLHWGDGAHRWDWRLSLGYDTWESSADAFDPSVTTSDPRFTPRDFHRDIRFNGQAVYRINRESKLSLGLGTSHIEQGDFETVNNQPGENSHLTTIRAYTRLDHAFDNDSTGYLQWFGNFAKTEWPGLQTNDSLENGLEAQYNFELDDSHDIIVGSNLRITRITTDLSSPEDVVFDDEPLHEEWVGVFALDRWQTSQRWVLETQLRGDYYSETHADWAGRLTSLYSLDSRNHHVMRLSGARAFRAPLAALNKIENSRGPLLPSPPFLPGTRPFTVVSPDELDNEGILSLELGYSGQINNFITFSCNTYFQHYNDLIGFVSISQTPVTALWTLGNIDDARAVGAEAEIAINGYLGQVSLWYAYNEFDPDRDDQAVRAFLPARNKAGISSRIYLPLEVILNLNYKYTDVTPNNPRDVPNIPSQFEISHRLDLTVSRQFFDGHFEWLVGVSDLFDETDFSVFGINNFAAHETPGRIFFTRLSFSF